MSSVGPAKFTVAVLVAAAPVVLTLMVSRPTFANAINAKLDQEKTISKKEPEYASDKYPISKRTDKVITRYMKTGPGKARELNSNQQS